MCDRHMPMLGNHDQADQTVFTFQSSSPDTRRPPTLATSHRRDLSSRVLTPGRGGVDPPSETAPRSRAFWCNNSKHRPTVPLIFFSRTLRPVTGMLSASLWTLLVCCSWAGVIGPSWFLAQYGRDFHAGSLLALSLACGLIDCSFLGTHSTPSGPVIGFPSTLFMPKRFPWPLCRLVLVNGNA